MALKLVMAGVVAMMAVRTRRNARPPLIAASGDNLALKPAPINPDWIIRGTPLARVADHSESDDKAGVTALWDCTAGEFRWYFGWDETVVIQEGEVHVTAEDGSQRLLREGDIAYFRGGTWAVWRIDNYVRKIAFLRKPFPLPLAAAYQLRNAFRSGGTGGLTG